MLPKKGQAALKDILSRRITASGEQQSSTGTVSELCTKINTLDRMFFVLKKRRIDKSLLHLVHLTLAKSVEGSFGEEVVGVLEPENEPTVTVTLR